MKSSEHRREERETRTAGSTVLQSAIFVPEEAELLVAEALGAKQCIVSTSADERIAEVCAGHVASFGEIHASAKTAIVEYCESRHRMFSVLTLRGKFAGFVQVSGPQGRPQFTNHDLNVLRILSIFIGKVVEADRLQKLSVSPFAQIALRQSTDQTIGDIVTQSIENPGQVSKILAKSFYREMTRAGFDFSQIIGAATEIISELADNVRKHSDRQRRRGG
ncbi:MULTISPECIES: hypothetical protein [Burkholderiaceae]|jgi:hypothetical protein|uniref:GAF domain-containing protein n=2 Tax=Burkholderiaceae TaxID=119060 RepID=B2T0Y0_PARPJ|nr:MULTISPECIES: hypothetical protein [Burkholderiaceae]MDP9546026.1 hypothetical protein [Burkholderia cepacia]UTP22416.1 hypothetical protein NMB33_00665 [Burkholderia sp. FXe9]ACD14700.1 hypothetical protein Bphyt_0273 [Paraburkholderia phytofirmans PsJN]MBR8391258.1 hypothetical protein [Burkholderia cenocepacia]MBR8473725.1 hypothetical protein [Burkholderia cenocepacia]